MEDLIVVRGAGDLASGIIAKLYACGFKVLALERDQPTAIRRFVSFSEAVWTGEMVIEGITAYYGKNVAEAIALLTEGKLVVAVDEEGLMIQALKPKVVVDAMIAKTNIKTTVDMAPLVIGVGPGHEVGIHCHAAVESMRGHNLGRIYYEGSPMSDTGIPGSVGGYTHERVCHAPIGGCLEVVRDIADNVKKDDLIARIDNTEVLAPIDGIIRGMLRSGTLVQKGMKLADIDPRDGQLKNCYTISDKARCIAGGVLEAIMVMGGTGR